MVSTADGRCQPQSRLAKVTCDITTSQYYLDGAAELDPERTSCSMPCDHTADISDC